MGKIAITHNWCRASSPCGSDDKAGSGEEAGSGSAAVPLRQRSVFATFSAVFRVHCFPGLSPVQSLGCSMAPNYVPSHPTRTPHSFTKTNLDLNLVSYDLFYSQKHTFSFHTVVSF